MMEKCQTRGKKDEADDDEEDQDEDEDEFTYPLWPVLTEALTNQFRRLVFIFIVLVLSKFEHHSCLRFHKQTYN